MTGPGPGKLRLEAQVFLWRRGEAAALHAEVYLHLRGWSRARVTHLDIEVEGLERLVGGVEGGVYGEVVGTGSGIYFQPFKGDWRLEVREKNVLPRVIKGGERVTAYMGGKRGGVFLGLKKPYPRLLEAAAREIFGVEPRPSTRRTPFRAGGPRT